MLVVDEAAPEPEPALERDRGRVGAPGSSRHLLCEIREPQVGPGFRRAGVVGEEVVQELCPTWSAEQLRVHPGLNLAILPLVAGDRLRIHRLRTGELSGSRCRREAVRDVGLAARQRIERHGDAARVVVDATGQPRPDVELDRHAATDEMLVVQPFDSNGLAGPERDEACFLGNQALFAEARDRLGDRVLDPLAILDGLENGGAPVLRCRPRRDLQDGHRLAAEGQAVVLRVPDVADVDRLGRVVVGIPLLPVQKRALRERGRARGRQGRDEHDARQRQERCRLRAAALGEGRRSRPTRRSGAAHRAGDRDPEAASPASPHRRRARPRRARVAAPQRRGPPRA